MNWSRLGLTPRRLGRVAAVVAGVILLLGLAAPFLNGARFSSPIKEALETALGRKVEFGEVHFTLLTGPGFSLDDVVIGEDPRYGLEPFAYVPTLNAHLRLDKLLLGEVRFSSLRLVDPALNLVKKSDGTWNVVGLLQRLGAPRRAPLNLFPVFQVSNARVNFKIGTRKTSLYILDSDLTVYPQHSGKLYLQFSGSPARTDRAGNGFGHLRGTANWYVNMSSAGSNQLEVNLTLDPSNFSEIATLLEGQDVGVHGMISSDLQIAGPLSALRVQGRLRLGDVHRWDLLPSSGGNWRIGYRGTLDLLNQNLNLETVPARAGDATPLSFELQARSFLTSPTWSVEARISATPARDFLPLARRMGLAAPPGLDIEGIAEGSFAVSSSAGVSGMISVLDATATLPDALPLHATRLNATFSGDRVHLERVPIQQSKGALEVSGDYSLNALEVSAYFMAADFAVDDLKSTIKSWFGVPPALDMLKGGQISGQLLYQRQATDPEQWSGRYQFTDATLTPFGLAVPLQRSEGRASFDNRSFELTRLTATAGGTNLRAAYRYVTGAKRPEHIRLEIPNADVEEIETLLRPTLKPQTLLARLPFLARAPGWLRDRNLEGDLTLGNVSANGFNLGPLTAHFVWEGTQLQLTSVQIKVDGGSVRARGNIDLSSYQPRYDFLARAIDVPWGGGSLSAEARVQSFGIGPERLGHLQASGTFTGQDLGVTPDDQFDSVSGDFDLTMSEGWPNLRLSNIHASDDEDAWTGTGSSQSDGRLVLDLQNADRQRHIISNLAPQRPAAISLALPKSQNTH